jgi:hypothetical protein
MWIRDVTQHVRVGQLLRLDHDVQRLRALKAIVGKRVALHDVEHHQRGNPLGIRRQLVDGPSTVGRGNGINPFRFVFLEIGERHRATFLARDRHDRVSGLALVKTAGVFLRDEAQRRREARILEELAGTRRTTVGQKGLLRQRFA